MSDRIRLDDMTSDQLDALYDDRDRLRAQLADTTSDRDRWKWYRDDAERRVRVQRERAEHAEQYIPRFTVHPVTPEIERAATERARQAAEDSERAAEWMAKQSGPHPAEARLAHLQATSEAAGRLLARESDRASQTEQRLLDMTLNRDQLQATLNRVRAATDQLHRAVLNIDGEPLSLYDRGVDTAVRRIREALDEAGVPGNTPKED